MKTFNAYAKPLWSVGQSPQSDETHSKATHSKVAGSNLTGSDMARDNVGSVAIESHQTPVPHLAEQLEGILERVEQVVASVWPLRDYVAVNPYAGLANRRFADASAFLRVFSDCETLMPLRYYSEQYVQGAFDPQDIQAALDELKLGGAPDRPNRLTGLHSDSRLERTEEGDQCSEGWKSDEVVAALESCFAGGPDCARHPRIKTISELVDQWSEVNWTEVIREELSKLCGSHYDQGQAVWSNPWRKLPLYQAWRSASVHDRHLEVLGVDGSRAFIASLPHTPQATIAYCLATLRVPIEMWETVLLSQAFCVPGWSAWTKHQVATAEHHGRDTNDFTGLLAIRLAYDTLLSRHFAVSQVLGSEHDGPAASFAVPEAATSNTTLRLIALRATEIRFRQRLLADIDAQPSLGSGHAGQQRESTETDDSQNFAQLVFCIDVRSERYRRQLEALSPRIATFGFAGFFGLPFEYVGLGQTTGSGQVPVLLKPQFKVYEGLRDDESGEQEDKLISQRRLVRGFRKLWSSFATSAVGCFSFVETTGLFYAWKLFSRSIGWLGTPGDPRAHERLGPTLRGLAEQGIAPEKRTDLAESILRNLSLTKNFGRLVAFCGHCSQTENNPLKAGLECGACGGHSGEPNARLAALLLNEPNVREKLSERGILIPAHTHFIAGLHNTTTDELQFFDISQVPATHRHDLEELKKLAKEASVKTRMERMPVVASDSMAELFRRSTDWSEVRPEWGLAGNAAFIIAPRERTRDVDLGGRSFLHSYDYRLDPSGSVLETIMTAPLVVAHLINMQYYASTVDDRYFGSGDKTVHNVVGHFGILSGNGGDLMTGLPLQSLHTGKCLQHAPMRLQAVIAAPREMIQRVLERHENLNMLLTNGWLHLVALDGGAYRYIEGDRWERL